MTHRVLSNHYRFKTHGLHKIPKPNLPSREGLKTMTVDMNSLPLSRPALEYLPTRASKNCYIQFANSDSQTDRFNENYSIEEPGGARTRVKSSVGLTDMIPVGVGLHQGSSLSPYLFAMIMDVLAR